MKIFIGQLFFFAASSCLVVVAGGGLTFLTRPVGAVYLVLWIVWLLVTVRWRKKGTPTVYSRKQQRILMLSGWLSIPFLVIAPPWEYAHFTGPVPRDGLIAWTGLVLFTAGIGLQVAAMRSLRGYYTVLLGAQSGQPLITAGPYRLVRHPGYLSYVIELIGIGLAMGSLVAFGLAVLTIPFLIWRIRGEEEMLIKHFGDEYRNYGRRTKKLIPYIF